MADLDRTGDLEVKIVGTDGTTYASVTSQHRLQVDAFSLQPFRPVSNYNVTGVNIESGTYTSLLTVSNKQGKLDFIAIAGATSNYQVKLDIDSATVYDISMSDLNTIGLANATNSEIWAEVANKNFRYRPNIPVDFYNSADVYAKATGATTTIYYIIIHREAVI